MAARAIVRARNEAARELLTQCPARGRVMCRGCRPYLGRRPHSWLWIEQWQRNQQQRSWSWSARSSVGPFGPMKISSVCSPLINTRSKRPEDARRSLRPRAGAAPFPWSALFLRHQALRHVRPGVIEGWPLPISKDCSASERARALGGAAREIQHVRAAASSSMHWAEHLFPSKSFAPMYCWCGETDFSSLHRHLFFASAGIETRSFPFCSSPAREPNVAGSVLLLPVRHRSRELPALRSGTAATAWHASARSSALRSS